MVRIIQSNENINPMDETNESSTLAPACFNNSQPAILLDTTCQANDNNNDTPAIIDFDSITIVSNHKCTVTTNHDDESQIKPDDAVNNNSDNNIASNQSGSENVKLKPKLLENKDNISIMSSSLSPSPSQKIIKNIFWRPKKPSRKDLDDDGRFEDTEIGSSVERIERGGGGAGELPIIVLIDDDDDDERNLPFHKQGEPIDKFGKDPRERDDPHDNGNRIPLFYQFLNCNRHVHEVASNLRLAPLRAAFLSKIMCTKSAQWLFLVAWIILLRIWSKDVQVQAIFITASDIGYLLMYCVWMIYVIAVVSARACEFGQKTFGAIILLLIETSCLAYILARILFTSEEYVLPATVFTIAATNVTLGILCYFSKADVSENSSIYSKATAIVFLTSAMSLYLSVTLYPPNRLEPNWGKKMIVISLLSFMVSETYLLMELSDIHFILRGYRFPVTEDDWLVVAASLF